MKTFILLLILSFNLFAGVQSKTEPESIDQVYQMVTSDSFAIKINRVISNQMINTNQFNIDGHIYFSGDSVRGDLPFFGRAYRLTPGSDGGIVFEGPIRTKKIVKKETRKKESITFNFTVRNVDDMLSFYITFTSNGGCSIVLHSNNRETITYLGELETDIRKKE